MYREGGLDFHAGTEEDVRVVTAALPSEVKDGLRYDAVPWVRFHHAYGPGGDVPARLEAIRLGDADAAERALGTLWNSICHQGGTSAVGALAVPFLLRIALAHPRHRADLLWLVGSVARRQHFGEASRTGLLRAGLPHDSMRWEPSGYPQNWSLEAARQAVTTDADLVLHLLDDPAPAVRQAAAFALAAAAPPPRHGPAALHARLTVEDDPAVRACLVLAIGQLAREEGEPDTAARLHEWWQDPTRPTDVRVSAALAWLCLVDDPIPDDLDTLLDTAVTDDLTALLAPVPWLRDAEDGGKDNGLLTALAQMRNPDDYRWLDY
ncbi:HEAT repeat domain-containing protein [Kitasatospora sp. NPDC093550]|uniref:HEAT repeat domain-containing protein n=1 Tax=Kitasatospora sp. NPDC093550 TaxID=3364089 RepID=UPI0038264120